MDQRVTFAGIIGFHPKIQLFLLADSLHVWLRWSLALSAHLG